MINKSSFPLAHCEMLVFDHGAVFNLIGLQYFSDSDKLDGVHHVSYMKAHVSYCGTALKLVDLSPLTKEGFAHRKICIERFFLVLVSTFLNNS